MWKFIYVTIYVGSIFFQPRDLLRLATEVIMRLDSHIVQIDAHYDHILVSTMTRTYIGNTLKWVGPPKNPACVGSMLGQRRRRWIDIKPTLAQCLCFRGYCPDMISDIIMLEAI